MRFKATGERIRNCMFDVAKLRIEIKHFFSLQKVMTTQNWKSFLFLNKLEKAVKFRYRKILR
jgi:hypothetical protein